MEPDIKDAAWNSLDVEHSFPVEGYWGGSTQQCGRLGLGAEEGKWKWSWAWPWGVRR